VANSCLLILLIRDNLNVLQRPVEVAAMSSRSRFCKWNQKETRQSGFLILH